MALIKCPECGREVSDKAAACIHCGFPLGQELNTKPLSNDTLKKIVIDVFDNLMLVVKDTTNERKTEGKPHTLVAIT